MSEIKRTKSTTMNDEIRTSPDEPVHEALEAEYRQMAQDELCEAEALEWADAMTGDFFP
jgi:hypothetical protein